MSLDETFAEVARLSAVQDPETEPFRSRYKARELLEAAREASADDPRALGLVLHHLGVNYAETEELSKGEETLRKAVELLDAGDDEPRVRHAAELAEAYNQLGILNANWGKGDEALRWLELASAVVKECEAAREAGRVDDARWAAVQGHYTHTLFFLAQVYGQAKDADKAAMYCFQTLARQLETGQFAGADWAENCIQLCQYYVNRGQVRQGLYLVNAAESVRPKPASGGGGGGGDDDDAKDDEGSRELEAKVARVRGSLHLAWLAESVQAFERRAALQQEGTAEERAEAEQKERDDAERLSHVEPFAALDLEAPPPCPLARDFAAARDIFVAGLRAYTAAGRYYVLDGFVTANVEIVQDTSQLYHLVCYFETDLSRKCKMYRRRITAMEPIITQLNPDVYSNIVRQLLDETARVYGAMMEMKLAVLRERKLDRASAEFAAAIGKVNKLALGAIRNHRVFLRLFNNRDGALPEKMDEELHRPYLTAKFEVAKILARVYSPSVEKLAELLTESIAEYKGIRDFVRRYNVADYDEEVKICAEMERLLPIKIARMRAAGIALYDL